MFSEVSCIGRRGLFIGFMSLLDQWLVLLKSMISTPRTLSLQDFWNKFANSCGLSHDQRRELQLLGVGHPFSPVISSKKEPRKTGDRRSTPDIARCAQPHGRRSWPPWACG